MSPRSMRKSAVGVAVVSAFFFALGLANLATGFAGGSILTVLALIGAASALGLALEMWYVSRRIARINFAKPS
jgi:hypothetical protein